MGPGAVVTPPVPHAADQSRGRFQVAAPLDPWGSGGAKWEKAKAEREGAARARVKSKTAARALPTKVRAKAGIGGSKTKRKAKAPYDISSSIVPVRIRVVAPPDKPL